MNNNKNSTKQPFGLNIAVKIALKAIHENVAPSSTILYNLFFLQKTDKFPKDLDTRFFSINHYSPNEVEKKSVSYILDELKKPYNNKEEFLEKLLVADWAYKKSPPEIKPKQAPIKNYKPKPPIKKDVPVPVVVIKKHKNIG